MQAHVTFPLLILTFTPLTYGPGNLLQKQGKIEESLYFYRRALLSDPNHAQTYYNQAVAFQVQERYEEAIECYSKTIQLDPGNSDAYYNLGTALQLQGRFNESIQPYLKALEAQPDMFDAWNNLGQPKPCLLIAMVDLHFKSKKLQVVFC